jgi:predicted DNA-binding protein (MmcQ/YjbR family)
VLRRAAKLSVGDPLVVTLVASADPAVLARAIEQSKVTTQPGKARKDALPIPVLDVAGPLARLRKICASWPGVQETTTFGHPTFQASKKTFAVLDDHERLGLLCLVIKVPLEEQARLLREPRFTPSKFGARHGWTSLVVDRQTDWKAVRSLLQTSYRRSASQRLIREFERVGEASRKPE